MQQPEHIVYFSSEEAVSSATHEEINQETVSLCKSMIYLRLGVVDETEHA